MALTTQQRADVARQLANELFSRPNATATLDHNDLLAAVTAVDGTFDALASDLSGTDRVRGNFHNRMPQRVRDRLTDRQREIIIARVQDARARG